MKSTLKMLIIMYCLCTSIVSSAFCQDIENDSNSFTLVSKDMEAQDILQMIARAARINLLFGKEVYGTISVNFKNIPPMEALQDICTACDLAVVEFDAKDHINIVVPKSRVNEFEEVIKGTTRTEEDYQQRITLKNHSMCVADILMITGRMGKINVIFEKEVTEKMKDCKMAAELHNVSPLATIQAVCMMNNLDIKESTDSGSGKKSFLIR